MPDAPDDYGLFPESSIDAVNDMGELAARLTTISPLHRSGNVIYWDNFSNGIGNLVLTPSGSAPNPKLANIFGYNGGYSLQMTTGPAIADSVEVSKNLGGWFDGGFGLDIIFSSLASNSELYMSLGQSRNNVGTVGQIIISQTDSAIYYLDSVGGRQLLLSLIGAQFTVNQQFDCKLVIDSDIDEYRRFYFGSLLIDMTGIALPTWAAVSPSCLSSIIYYKATSIGAKTVYIGGYAITIGEP